MAEPADDLRTEIDRHLNALGDVDELDDERYHLTHERFEAASNQRERILEWFATFLGSRRSGDQDPFELLSVGCGGGVMDRRIADTAAAARGPVHVTGIDPNPRHIPAFRAEFDESPHPIETFIGGFEDFEGERRYDLVYFLHCLYYFEHIEQPLADAVDRLGPDGAIVVLQAPNDDLNHLADRVWRKQFSQSAWYSDDVRRILESMDGRTSCERIDARVDVTPCFRADDPAGEELLDFIVQAETRRFSEDFRGSLRDSLRAICDADGDRLYAAHPVDVLVHRPA